MLWKTAWLSGILVGLWDNGPTTKDGPGGATNTVLRGLADCEGVD